MLQRILRANLRTFLAQWVRICSPVICRHWKTTSKLVDIQSNTLLLEVADVLNRVPLRDFAFFAIHTSEI
jgi:hypothetical protein